LDVIKLRIRMLRWGNYPGLFQQSLCHYNAPYKSKTGRLVMSMRYADGARDCSNAKKGSQAKESRELLEVEMIRETFSPGAFRGMQLCH
jgi:hypothetical protein